MSVPARIAVLVKQVPHPEHFHKIVIDPEKMTIRRDGIPTAMNPLDKIALEAALRLKEAGPAGIQVDAISMGPPSAQDVLDESLAIGADRAILLCDRALAGADTLATALSLAAALKRCGPYFLIAAGLDTVDGGTGQVPAQVAEALGIPHVTSVIRAEAKSPEALLVDRKVERGCARLLVRLPAVLTFTRGCVEPRIPSAMDVIRASRKNVDKLALGDLDLEPDQAGLQGSPTRVIGLTETKRRRGAGSEVFSGKAEAAVEQALRRLKELGAL